jgi:hypothetical protein
MLIPETYHRYAKKVNKREYKCHFGIKIVRKTIDAAGKITQTGTWYDI